MDTNHDLCVKIIHCGNINIANPRDRGQKNIFYMPMGLFSLADALKRKGIDIEIIHLDLEAGQELRDILDFSSLDAVGFDCHWLNQSLTVLETAELIKQIKPGGFIFLGGFTASLFCQEIMRDFLQIDAIIRGDGEIPIIELCQALLERKKNPATGSLAQVQNLVWREDNNEIRLNDFTYVASPEDMEGFDFAAVDLLRNWQLYQSACRFFTHYEPVKSSPLFYLEVGRGCQYACTFCGGNCEAQKRMNNRGTTSFMSAASAVKTIKKAISSGFETFYTCMEWNGSSEWYTRLFNRLKQENTRINFCYGSWGLPSKALADAASASCRQVIFEISPETSNLHLRKKNKDPRLFYTNRQLEEFLDYVSTKPNIKVQLCFGYYLAGDTKETIFDTVRCIINLITRYHDFLEIEYSNFSTDPGSLFFFFPGKYDLDINVKSFSDYIKYLKEYYQLNEGQPADMTLYRPRTISRQEDAEIRRKLMLLNYLFSDFRKSVSYMLEKTMTPDIVMEILEIGGVSTAEPKEASSHKTRDTLIKICKKKNILDMYLFKLIDLECEKQEKKTRESRPTTQLYLDITRERRIMAALEKEGSDAAEGNEKVLLFAANKIREEEDFDF